VEDEWQRPVEPGAHFYRPCRSMGTAMPSTNENAWATRSVVYVHLIPPGAADTRTFVSTFRTMQATKSPCCSLNYRKFSWSIRISRSQRRSGKNGAGRPWHGDHAGYDDRKWRSTATLRKCPATSRRFPIFPSSPLRRTLRLCEFSRELPPPPNPRQPAPKKIGRAGTIRDRLFLQGDLKAAAVAFEKITQATRKIPTAGPTSAAFCARGGYCWRAKSSGEIPGDRPAAWADEFLLRARLKEDGDYDGAIAHLQIVLAQFRAPCCAQRTGRVLFLERRYADAVKEFEQTLSIDPKTCRPHYNLMLCYNGLGNDAKANEHKARYLRFKADEWRRQSPGLTARLIPRTITSASDSRTRRRRASTGAGQKPVAASASAQM